MAMNRVYLTRRNLLTLLNKLDRPESRKTIIKYDDAHAEYPCTTPTIVTAVEDSDYYTDRPPGDIFHKDQPDFP
jgi:hypothetical protein